jgi:ABC-2 type transport system permease protein
MKPVIIIALNDTLISVKERATFLTGLLMPVLMMVLLGVAQGGNDGATITIDVIDEDGSKLSAQFVGLLTDEMQGEQDAFRVCAYHSDTAEDCDLPDDIADTPGDWRSTADDRLEKTDTYGAIIIEDGFGDHLRAGDTTTVTFKNSGNLSAPTLAQQKIDAAISRMSGSVAIANLTVGIAEETFAAFDPNSPERAAAFDSVLDSAETAWQDRPITVNSQSTKEQVSRSGFNQSGPGTTTMFVLMMALSAASILVYERKAGTLQRLYTLPIAKWQIITGKLLSCYLVSALQFIILIGVGMLMGVEWGDNIVGLALVILIFPLTSTALGLALATVARTSAQASSLQLLLGLTLAPLGGAWWPLEIVPDFMKTIGHISPIAWAMDALQEMMFYDGTVIDILPMLGVLLGMAAVFFAFGVWNFKYE